MAEAIIYHIRVGGKVDPIDPEDFVRLKDVGGVTPGGGGGSYEHAQATAATTWSINHDLDRRYVAVQAVSAAGVVMVPEVNFVDDDNVVLTFAQARDGVAIIRR